MLAVLEVTADQIIADNRWTNRWGANELPRPTHRLFGSPVVTDVYVIQTTPTFSSACRSGT
jgi:hypothetical protein